MARIQPLALSRNVRSGVLSRGGSVRLKERVDTNAPDLAAAGIGNGGEVYATRGDGSPLMMIPATIRAAIPGRKLQATKTNTQGGSNKGWVVLAQPIKGLRIQVDAGDQISLPGPEPLSFTSSTGADCYSANVTTSGQGGDDSGDEEDEGGSGGSPGGSDGTGAGSPKGGENDPCVNPDTGCEWYVGPPPAGTQDRGTATFGSDPGTVYHLGCSDDGSAPPGAGCPPEDPPSQSPPGSVVCVQITETRTDCWGAQATIPTVTQPITAPWSFAVTGKVKSPYGCPGTAPNPGQAKFLTTGRLTWTNRDGSESSLQAFTQYHPVTNLTAKEVPCP